MIKADKHLLVEIVQQIADNSIKFSSVGEIIFCINEKDNSGISITIKDSGKGISKEFMKDLFKPFRQEDMSYSRNHEGNGLGLAIAKKCCDLCGFELIVSSVSNNGTTVEIIVPLDKLYS